MEYLKAHQSDELTSSNPHMIEEIISFVFNNADYYSYKTNMMDNKNHKNAFNK